MEALPQNVSDDHLTVTLRNTQSKSSKNEREKSLPIPVDLIIEIFSRLPFKSIGRCRCVSKHWGSILRLPDFTELFFSMALARPQLLFAYLIDSKLVFYSVPQPQNPNENSSPLAATYHMSLPFGGGHGTYKICNHVNGLILLKHMRKEKKETVQVICNPSTGQSLSLPKVERRSDRVRSYFGYDPVEKQYKVLLVTSSEGFEEYQVLTLGEPSWRMIECIRPHYPLYSGICINGVLYYIASVTKFIRASMVVCFDVRSEKFRFIEVVEPFIRRCYGNLINYNGKLATGLLSTISQSIEMWVLEDADKQEWSNHTYVLPDSRQNVVHVRFAGVTRTNEILLTSYYIVPFYLFYYNMERKTIIRLQIQGMDVLPNNLVKTFLNYIEDVKLL